MLPKVIEYKVDGNVLRPLVYVDLTKLMDEYDMFMIGVKQVQHKKKRGA